MPQESHALWQMVVDLWNTANPDLAGEVFAALANYRQSGHFPIHGPQEIAQWIAAVRTRLP